MKWTMSNEAAQMHEKINTFVLKTSTSKVFYVLLTLASLAVLASAGDKWKP